MRYFGIKTPEKENEKSYIWWIAEDEHRCWMQFFTYPNKNNEMNSHRLPLFDAIRAYKAIGYKCIELEIKEKI